MWGSPSRRDPANALHILARGWTHLPFGLPRFGTVCAANGPRPEGAVGGGSPMPTAVMGDGDMLQGAPMEMARNDPAAHDH